MSIQPDIDGVTFTELVGDIEPPCEYDRLFRCGPAAAKWIMFGRCPKGHGAERLVCESCKEAVLAMPDGLACPAACGEVVVPARHVFVRIERL